MAHHTFRLATLADAARCFEIETAAFESDAAATLEKITKRIALYPRGFLVCEDEGDIVGFINSGCAFDVIMSDEAFKELVGHDPAAPKVVILSVAVDPSKQGRGYAKRLMAEFIDRMKAMEKTTVHLICREHHLALYEKLGFRYTQPSASAHGGMRWHEMMMSL